MRLADSLQLSSPSRFASPAEGRITFQLQRVTSPQVILLPRAAHIHWQCGNKKACHLSSPRSTLKGHSCSDSPCCWLSLSLQLNFSLCSFWLPLLFYKGCYHRHFLKIILDTKLSISASLGTPLGTSGTLWLLPSWASSTIKILKITFYDCTGINTNILILYVKGFFST